MANTSPNFQQEGREDYFPLFELPPELRVTIYEMALVESGPIQLTTFCNNQAAELSKGDFCNLIAGSRALQTSRQIRAEASPIFYARNTFAVALFNINEMATGYKWLQSIAVPSRALMGHVVVHESEWRAERKYTATFDWGVTVPDPFLPGCGLMVKTRIDDEDYRVVPLNSINFDVTYEF